MDDASGISDHAFGNWFIVAATVVIVAAMAYRFIAFRGHRVLPESVDAHQVAFLAGGPQLAVYAALGQLHGAGVVDVSPDGVLIRTAPLLVDSTALDRAVYDVAAGGHGAGQLLGFPTVSAALARICDGLEQAGLLLSPSQRASNRWFVYAECAVAATGVARVAADLVNGVPVGFLLKAFVLVGLFLLFIAAVPRRTRAGAAVLAGVRRRYAHLAPTREPSPRSDGVGATAMGIGLFGVRSLYALDPVFASDVGAPRPLRTVYLGGG